MINISSSNLSIFCFFARFFMKECYAMLYPYTTELYPTLLRTIGFGWASGVGRLGSFTMPYIIFPLYNIN